MSELEENICRFCLSMVTHKFNTIDEVMRNIFDVLFLKLDFEVSENPIICQECVEIAVKSLNFKSVCVDTEQIISSYAASRKKRIFNIRDMYEDNIDVKCEVGEEFIICRFCMHPLNMSQSIALDILMEENLCKKPLLEYMPEMDFNAVKNPMICTTCLVNLQHYFEFVRNCLVLEEKINAYFEENGTDDGGYIKLSDLLCLAVNGEVECPTKSPQTFTMNRKSHAIIFGDENSKLPEINAELVQQEELDIKDDGISIRVNIHHKLPEIGLDTYEDRYSEKTCKEMEFNTMPLKTQKSMAKKCSEIEMDKQTLQIFESKQKKCAKRVKLTNKVTSKVDKCTSGMFKSRRQLGLKNHIKIHKASPTAKQKDSVNRAMCKNDDGAKMKIYACKLCTFKTHHSGSFSNHTVVHRDISKIETYHCSQCPYKSKYKCAIKRHNLIHEDISKIQMYDCSECPYKSKYKSHLNQHMLVHRDISEIEMFHCSKCTFKFKRKYLLSRHMLVHKDISKSEIYNCSECTFTSKYKTSLNKHMLIHKHASEIKMYKCSECAFKSKDKSAISKHVLVHKDISKIQSYDCSECSYRSKYKGHLKRHVLVHRDIS